MHEKVVVAVMVVLFVVLAIMLWRTRGHEGFDMQIETEYRKRLKDMYHQIDIDGFNTELTTFPANMDIGIGHPNAYFYEMPNPEFEKLLDAISTRNRSDAVDMSKFELSDMTRVPKDILNMAYSGLLAGELGDLGFTIPTSRILAVYETTNNQEWIVCTDVVFHRPSKQQGKVVYVEFLIDRTGKFEFINIALRGVISEDVFALQSSSLSSWSSSRI